MALDISGMLDHIKGQLPPLLQLLTAAMYLTGIFFIYKAVLGLKQYSEMRSFMSSGTTLKGPMIYFFVGAMLIFYPSAINTGLDTLYGSNYITPYTPSSSSTPEANSIYQDIGFVLRFIGYISFFRGWVILTYLGGQSAPPNTFGRALNHIIGGILLVNIFGLWQILKNSFGWGS